MSLLRQLHCIRVPLDDFALFDAEIAEQSCAGCAESEDGVFHHWLAAANRPKEVLEVVVAVQVAVLEVVTAMYQAAGRRTVMHWIPLVPLNRVLATPAVGPMATTRFPVAVTSM